MKKRNLLIALSLMGGILLVASAEGAWAAAAGNTNITSATFADLAQQSTGAVVNISTKKVVKTGFGQLPNRKFFENFFGPLPKRLEIRALGSGIIMDPRGYVITNNHVIDGAQEIKVLLTGGREFEATVKGRDPKTDLALIHIVNPPSGLPSLKLGDSDAVRVGDWVMAIGNPFGLNHTVTQGIISAKGRVIGAGPYDRFLQTDALINPGNSGGPLLNLQGEVIGINTAILTKGQGIGFAIPSNMAKFIIPQLMAKGKVTRGLIGVQVEFVTSEIARKAGLSQPRGVLVVKVNPGSPAQKAGIRPGDLILDFNGQAVQRMNELPDMVAETPPGTEVTVTVLRKGKEMKLKLKVAEMPEKPHPSQARAHDNPFGLPQVAVFRHNLCERTGRA
jgi:serine protease Do